LGQDIIIHTNHKNLLYKKSALDRIIQWHLLVKEYAPTFIHIKGIHNVVTDALSRLDTDFDITVNNQPDIYKQAHA
jgi:hypothetical protein